MTNKEFELLDNQFFATNQLSYLGDFLLQFSNTSYFSVCVKDAKTKTVCMSNTVCNKLWGFSGNEMVGMTAREILTRVPDFANVEDALARVEAAENQSIASDQQSNYVATDLTYDGFVKVRRAVIVPLHGASSSPLATANVCLDITQNVNLLRLLDIYKLYYPKSKALSRFSEHLNLKRYFIKLPSFEELKTVLTMVRKPRHKDIAIALALSPKTVSNYLYSVKDKLKSNVGLEMMISSLRDYQQWGFEL